MEQSSQDMPTIEGEIPIGENPHESHDRDHPLGDSTIDSMDGSTVDEETNDSQNDNNHFGGNLAGYVFYKKYQYIQDFKCRAPARKTLETIIYRGNSKCHIFNKSQNSH